MTDIQNPGPKGEVGRSHGRPGTVKETLLFDQEIREGQTVSLFKHTGGEAVAVALWNASWHSEQGKACPAKLSNWGVEQGGSGRADQDPRGAAQNNTNKQKQSYSCYFFLMNSARGDTFSKFSWHSIEIWLFLVWVCAPRNGSVPMKAGELHSIQTTDARQSPLECYATPGNREL